MDKVFHVFISSTYLDLTEARGKVSEAVAKAGYVAEGMEIFPASSQQQMDFIRRVIDRCDYYVLIIGGRYGSTNAEGKSYTELEFEYAKSKGIPILAFLRDNVEELPKELRDTDDGQIAALANFRNLITSDSLVDFWTNPDDLATKSLAALSQSRQSHPGIGWLRANVAASSDILSEINQLRKEKASLEDKINRYSNRPKPTFENLAELEDLFEFGFNLKRQNYAHTSHHSLVLSWSDIFRAISPNFRTFTNTTGVQHGLSRYICDETDVAQKGDNVRIDMPDSERMLIQFESMGLLESQALNLKTGGAAIFHRLTNEGNILMLKLNAVFKT